MTAESATREPATAIGTGPSDMSSPYWTATEAISWLVFGELRTSEQMNQSDHADFLDHLNSRGDPLARSKANEAWDHAIRALCGALLKGQCVCLGVPIASPSEGYVEIPRIFWMNHVNIKNDETHAPDGGDWQYYGKARKLSPRYSDLRIKSSEVRKLESIAGRIEKHKEAVKHPSKSSVERFFLYFMKEAARSGRKAIEREVQAACLNNPGTANAGVRQMKAAFKKVPTEYKRPVGGQKREVHAVKSDG